MVPSQIIPPFVAIESAEIQIEPILDQVRQLERSGQGGEAVKLCEQVLADHPHLSSAWHLLGLIKLRQGEQQAALAPLEKAIQYQDSIAVPADFAALLTHAGVVYCQLGQFAQGVAYYQQALEQQPEALDTRYNLALALQKLGQWEAARATYFQVLAQQPDYIWAHQQLGNLCQQQQQQQEAIAHYRQALSLEPTFAPAQQALSTLLRQPPASSTTPAIASSAIVPDSNPQNLITCTADEGFQTWLSQAGGSVAISTYQAGKLALVGWDGQQITLLLRQFDKPMGMAVQGQRLALATRHQVLLFANSPTLAQGYLEDQPGRYDALYLPRAAYFTGDLNVHDMAWGDEGLWMVNSRFSCLSQVSSDFSFVPRWQPPFISELVPEDRCHLNGLAMVAGKPGYVTALGATDEVGGWRSRKAEGGVVMEVASGDIVVSGLSMPHSPVWHDGALWVLNSGAGELLRVEPQSGQRSVVCTLSGFLRGLCFVGNYALVGLCQIREQHIFGQLPVQERYEHLDCGVALIDLRSGTQVGLLEFPAGCEELYGVQFLAGYQRPNILNPEKLAHQQAVTAPEVSYWLRPSALSPV